MPVSKHTSVATAALRAQADRRAERLRPLVDRLQAEGITSCGGFATALNRRCYKSPCRALAREFGGELLARLAALDDQAS